MPLHRQNCSPAFMIRKALSIIASTVLLAQLKASDWGGAVVAGVIAHEFGHLFQLFSNYMRELRGLDTTVKFVECTQIFFRVFTWAVRGILST